MSPVGVILFLLYTIMPARYLFFMVSLFLLYGLAGWYIMRLPKEGFEIRTIDTPVIQSEINKLPPADIPYHSALDHHGHIQKNKYLDMPLVQWAIKGAYNAPRTGNYVGTEGIDYVLAKGCRWLDIEAYYLNEPNDDGSPIYDLFCGGAKTAKDTSPTTYNQSLVPVSSVIHHAIEHGFHNMYDPLFISVRFRMNRADYGSATRHMVHIIQSCREQFPKHIIRGKVSPSIPIGQLAKKVVFVMDSVFSDYSTLYDYMNITIPGDGWAKSFESALQTVLTNTPESTVEIRDDYVNTQVMTVMQPDATESGRNIPAVMGISKLGFQVPLIKYYLSNDDEQAELDRIFGEHKTGMVPLTFLLANI